MGKVIDLVGVRVGKLQVISREGLDPHNRATWRCLCDCGNHHIVTSKYIITKISTSCGCDTSRKMSNSHTTHGHSLIGRTTKEYRTWSVMKDRCHNPSSHAYHHYGGRGITVCDSWRSSFESFLADMGRAPSSKHSIDRINVNGNYEPNNCRWATQKEQRNNTRSTIYLTHNGIKLSASQWSEKLQIKHSTLVGRLKEGWTVERALGQRVEKHSKRKKIALPQA